MCRSHEFPQPPNFQMPEPTPEARKATQYDNDPGSDSARNETSFRRAGSVRGRRALDPKGDSIPLRSSLSPALHLRRRLTNTSTPALTNHKEGSPEVWIGIPWVRGVGDHS